MNHLFHNGQLLEAGAPVLTASNQGYRYGDGLFETMKLYQGKIALASLHFERLFRGISLLQYDASNLPGREELADYVNKLASKNQCTDLARVRLSVSRGNGGIGENQTGLDWILECWPADHSINQLNDQGWVTGIFPDARKSCDMFSHLKSANYLPYVMASRYAKSQQLNDVLLLNQYDRIAEASIANLFMVKDDTILTPSLQEGCVDGVMRRHLLEMNRDRSAGLGNYTIHEEVLTIDDLLKADELFLTNSLYGIRWIGQFLDNTYTNKKTNLIYQALMQTIL